MEKKQYKAIRVWVCTHDKLSKKVSDLNENLKPNQKKWSIASYLDSLVNKKVKGAK